MDWHEPWPARGDLDDWEIRWAPYDEPTYQTALSYVLPADVVLDIGAGDLHLARRMARVAKQVYAIELNVSLVDNTTALPDNLTVIRGDARWVRWPNGISLGVLLMRHCTCVRLYVDRLRAGGCRRLVTNARWGMDVELMDLGPRAAWTTVKVGWYACTCGQVGFKPGPPAELSADRLEAVTEVEWCPACMPSGDAVRNDLGDE